ncbi:hypothetical protein M5W68_17075, partial [Paenibacillus larvae]|nr:hypothetical protein [Paenibacillus larvae]
KNMRKGKRSPKQEKPVELTLDQLKRMPGRCNQCAGYRFKLRYEGRQLIRECQSCGTKIKV